MMRIGLERDDCAAAAAVKSKDTGRQVKNDRRLALCMIWMISCSVGFKCYPAAACGRLNTRSRGRHAKPSLATVMWPGEALGVRFQEVARKLPPNSRLELFA